jgi:hypothetical protein
VVEFLTFSFHGFLRIFITNWQELVQVTSSGSVTMLPVQGWEDSIQEYWLSESTCYTGA